MGMVAHPPLAALAHSLLMDTSETKMIFKSLNKISWKPKVKKTKIMLKTYVTFDIFKNLLGGAKFM